MHSESYGRNPEGGAKARTQRHELCACDPIDSELCLGWMKPGETLVEVLSRSDVQFDGRTWV